MTRPEVSHDVPNSTSKAFQNLPTALHHRRSAYGSQFISTECAKFPTGQCLICDARNNVQVCSWLRNDPKLAGCMNSAGVPIYWTRRVSREESKALKGKPQA